MTTFLTISKIGQLCTTPSKLPSASKIPLEDVLYKQPKRVLIENDKTEFFFKPCYSIVQSIRELKTYKTIVAADLDRYTNLCYLYGVVMDDQGFKPDQLPVIKGIQY